MDDLHTVVKYLKKEHKPEEPLPSKSQDRVLTDMARVIRRTKAPGGGRCQTCGCQDDRLLPVTLKVCPQCVETFRNKCGFVRIQKKDYLSGQYCDWSFGKTFTIYTINPYICRKCMIKLGRKHQTQMPHTRKLMARDAQRRPF